MGDEYWLTKSLRGLVLSRIELSPGLDGELLKFLRRTDSHCQNQCQFGKPKALEV